MMIPDPEDDREGFKAWALAKNAEYEADRARHHADNPVRDLKAEDAARRAK